MAAPQPQPDPPQNSGGQHEPTLEPTLDFGGEEQAEQLVQILDQYLADLKAGKSPERDALLAQHPQLAQQLNACLAGLEFIQGAAEPASPAPPLVNRPQKMLGDFRILREVGRGGMGAVYEAVQVSLGRRVALKVLRYAGVSDPEAIDRFQREAETVAQLHHTNIVPVFAVGCDHGVNYYAMQFIDGQSLADVLARRTAPLAISDVAHWGLQAAEALAHAHQRNVIHRDVKPSNLLLAPDGRIWLTDFGLARRLDDVTLSMTGALLGTPRYMSPEQASATRRLIDRRTDVYSLGATLYELLSGQPAFQGDSPHQVIQQILTAAPRPLRELRPDVPRDLETVVMKCLAKDAAQRYLTARELADDLRACLEQRPIRARRANLAERTARWIRDHRQTFQNSSFAVAATLLVVVASVVSWNLFQVARQSPLSLTSKSGPLTAEILDSSDHSLATVPVPTDRPVPLPGGPYTLRVAAPNRWDRKYQVELSPGEASRIDLSLNDQQLWPATEIANSYQLVDDSHGGALVHLNADGVRLESHLPKRLRWSITLAQQLAQKFPDAPAACWPWFDSSGRAHFTQGASQRSPLPAAKTVDVDGDGVRDLILAARHQAYVLVLSGANGQPLWLRPLGHDVRQAPKPQPFPQPLELRSSVLFAPLVVPDQNNDQVDDLLVSWTDTPGRQDAARSDLLPSLGGNLVACERRVELLSGASGESLWQALLPEEPFQLEHHDECPPEFHWLVGNGFGVSSGMSGGSYLIHRHLIRNALVQAAYHGPFIYRFDEPRLVAQPGQNRVLAPAGDHLLTLHLADGSLLQDDPLPARPGSPGRWADCDGDGHVDFVFRSPRVPPAGIAGQYTDISVYSPKLQKTLWTTSLDSRFPQRESFLRESADWPVVADLDGDGASEVIAPHVNSFGVSPNLEIPWGSLVVLDGKNGGIRFESRIVDCDQQINRFLVGPDVDGDGHRDLFVASLSEYPLMLHIDCLSGRNGATLWTRPHSFHDGIDFSTYHLAAISWWNASEDGWPQLIVTVQAESSNPNQSETFLASAADGRLLHHRTNVARCDAIDVDRDGIDDLVAYVPTNFASPENGGMLDCLRGVAGEPWNRLGFVGVPADDFNRDGFLDLLATAGAYGIQARCGKTGKGLWQAQFPGAPSWLPYALARPPHLEHSRGDIDPSLADLDGDGVGDVFAWHSRQMGSSIAPFVILSGRTGRTIWEADQFPARASGGIQGWRLADLERDGRPELLVAFASDFDYDQWRMMTSSADLQWWLAVFDAPSGRLRWKTPLSLPYGSSAPTSQNPAAQNLSGQSFPIYSQDQSFDMLHLADLDGDGVDDVVSLTIGESGDQFELKALRGSDGASLWKHPLPPSSEMQNALFHHLAPRLIDVDGDRRLEIALVQFEPLNEPGTNRVVPVWKLLDGATGKVRTTFSLSPIAKHHAAHVLGDRTMMSDLAVVRVGDGRQAVAASMVGEPSGALCVWNGVGPPQIIPLPQLASAPRLHPIDLDEDGLDEVAVRVDRQAWIVDPRRASQPLWRSPDELGPLAQVLAARRVSEANGRQRWELAALREPGDNTVLGIEAPTGRVVWSCPGPLLREAQGNMLLRRIEPLNQDPNALPHYLFQAEQLAICRQAALVDAGVIRDVALRTPAVRAFPKSPRRDSRWGRYLPWHIDSGNMGEVFQILFAAALLSLLLVVAPLAYLQRLVRRGRWSLRSMFIPPLFVGVMFLVSTVRPPLGVLPSGEVAPGPGLRWFIALVAAPAVIFGLRLLIWSCRWQWKRVALWLGLTVCASLVLAVVGLAADHLGNSSDPRTYYLWDGWYVILGMGFYFLSWPALPIITVVDWWRERRRRARAAEGGRERMPTADELAPPLPVDAPPTL
ncbi:MAG: protein kinase [Pirellulales bacterium]